MIKAHGLDEIHSKVTSFARDMTQCDILQGYEITVTARVNKTTTTNPYDFIVLRQGSIPDRNGDRVISELSRRNKPHNAFVQMKKRTFDRSRHKVTNDLIHWH